MAKRLPDIADDRRLLQRLATAIAVRHMPGLAGGATCPAGPC